MSDLKATLEERGIKYGRYSDQASLSQELKLAMRKSQNWNLITTDKKESLELVAMKISRILTGDPEDKDSWHDIQGYAALIERTLR